MKHTISATWKNYRRVDDDGGLSVRLEPDTAARLKALAEQEGHEDHETLIAKALAFYGQCASARRAGATHIRRDQYGQEYALDLDVYDIAA